MKIILEKRIEEITNLHLVAFGEEEGEEVSNLAKEFLEREDIISVSAEEEGKILGNVIFSPFKFDEAPNKKYFLLAPLGILPKVQNKGLGKKLIEAGVEHLKSLGGEAILVLGIPTYYPKVGFKPTHITSCYSDIMTVPEAWMALEIIPNALEGIKGPGVGIEPIMKEELWDTRGR